MADIPEFLGRVDHSAQDQALPFPHDKMLRADADMEITLGNLFRADGSPVDFVLSYYRGDIYDFVIELRA